MKTRMQPIGNAWQKLPRVVRDLSAELGKQIELEMHGAETELDRQVLDRIKDPLTHMVRNSADHGIETPARPHAPPASRKGHDPAPAYHEGGHIIIEDRRRRPRPRHRAGSRPRRSPSGLATEAEIEKMSEAQIQRFIFAPGFSTAAKVTSVSGRGVGMDVVQTNIDQIGGTIDVKSVPGEGTELHHQDSAHACDHLGADRRGRRRALRHPAARGDRAGAREGSGSEHRIEHIKDTPVLRLRNKLLPLDPSQQAAAARRRRRQRRRKRLHRGDPDRQPDRSASWSTACSTPRKSS